MSALNIQNSSSVITFLPWCSQQHVYGLNLQEIEATVASLVERGVIAESEIVASLQQVLPEQFQQLIPSELRSVAPQSPTVTQQQAQEAFYEEPPLSAEQMSISQSGMHAFRRLNAHCMYFFWHNAVLNSCHVLHTNDVCSSACVHHTYPTGDKSAVLHGERVPVLSGQNGLSFGRWK